MIVASSINRIKNFISKLLGTSVLEYIEFYIPSKKRSEIDRKRKQFYSNFLTSKDLFFDIGANYGNRIKPILKLGASVVAVEPQQECVNFLKKVYGRRISIVPKGAGSSDGQETFFISNASTLSSFSKKWIKLAQTSGRFNEYSWDKKETIEMTTLDKLIQDFGLPQFIKIDVEGYELEVLKGLTKPINFISFEYAVPEQLIELEDCLLRLDEIYEGHIDCNYSIGESMELFLSEWISVKEFIIIMKSNDFEKTSFGDIYVKFNSKRVGI